MKQIMVIIWATAVALALMYVYWSKGRYEIVKISDKEIARLDKNTGEIQRFVLEIDYDFIGDFIGGKTILKRNKWEQPIEE